MNFDWGYALETLPGLLSGLVITLQATVLGMLVALTLGLLLAVLRHAGGRWIGGAARHFIEFVRSTPLLIQLYFLFYVLPGLGVTLSPLFTGVLALGVHYAAYCAEVYRAGINSVPRGQWEAAASLGYPAGARWRRIILPQAIPPVIPALGNYLIAMFKDTPLLSAITVMEVLQVAKIAGAESFRYLEPLTLVGVMFLVLSLTASRLVRRLEARYGRQARPA